MGARAPPEPAHALLERKGPVAPIGAYGPFLARSGAISGYGDRPMASHAVVAEDEGPLMLAPRSTKRSAPCWAVIRNLAAHDAQVGSANSTGSLEGT